MYVPSDAARSHFSLCHVVDKLSDDDQSFLCFCSCYSGNLILYCEIKSCFKNVSISIAFTAGFCGTVCLHCDRLIITDKVHLLLHNCCNEE